jgi:signal transduction histidine kinase
MINPQIFRSTRLKLAGWYAAGMGIVLSVMGGYIYIATNQNYWDAVHQELASLTGTLHDSLEPKLKIPGVVDPSIKQEILMNICVVGECPISQQNTRAASDQPHRHTLGISQQGAYYLRFYDLSQKLIATAGQQPVGDDRSFSSERSSTLLHDAHTPLNNTQMSFHDDQGVHYHRFSVAIATVDHRPWGFLQVGRSMQEFDERAARLQIRLLIVLPAITLLVALISWYLAGQAMQPIHNSYKKMQQFTADAAHELRTPLSAMLATIEAAQQPDSIEEALEALDTVERQTDRLIQLAEDLLTLSRLDSRNGSNAIQETCHLHVVVTELIKNLSALAVSTSIDLRAVIQIANPIQVQINYSQANRLLTNLVMNALQNTTSGGAVTLTLTQVQNFAIIQVHDTGVGIAPNNQARIFDRFHRVNQARTRPQGGAGLGLAIVQEIVRSHHGSIEVKSKLGVGSNFIVKLPLAKQH